ncbi:hypothetical protein BRPE67_DCDS11650 (plasmid) [Caballeronia cordobensis]|nr:hypothetical protein BRPE67_DCDS11650 [Burkholderia sp. RPE67]
MAFPEWGRSFRSLAHVADPSALTDQELIYGHSVQNTRLGACKKWSYAA